MIKKLKNVLLIEDDEPTIFLTKLVFESLNCAENISTCSDGEEAIKYLQNYNTPELILLDINMPGMDGWEFIEQYDNIDLKNKNDIKIFMMSTSIFEKDKLKALNNDNINGFLNKPITINTLQNILNENF